MAPIADKVQHSIAATMEALRQFNTGNSPGTPGDEVDPTLPGNPASKKEDIGNVLCLWNPLRNRGLSHQFLRHSLTKRASSQVKVKRFPGTNFSFEEREEAQLHGLLPPAIEDLALQSERVMYQIDHEASHDLERYVIMQQLAASNASLYFYTIVHNLKRLAPIIYTPTVGQACQQFDRIYSNSLGMYFDSFRLRGRFRQLLEHWPSRNVQIVVVTDGGRILGLGDLGTNGMGIPIGKVALYVAGAGFHPEHSLPAILDVGTNNQELLKDKFYLGTRKPRLGDEEHMAVVEEFCGAVRDKWPHCLVQFEDFPTDRAFAVLERMRRKQLCFNDDIQGTAAVVLAGLINGLKGQHTELKEARFLFYGAGSSAVGVAQLLMTALHKMGGLTRDEARKHIWAMDSKGIITTTRGDKLPSHKAKIAREDSFPVIKDLREAVERVKPHALIGLTGRGPAFGKEVVEELCKISERPIIMALSNPTDRSEITAEDAINWSGGKAIFTAGSPFPPVEHAGKTIEIGQANNVLIFPGVGFGAVMAKAKCVEDEMFLAAARALADSVPQSRIEGGTVYPHLEDLRDTSARVAAAVVEEALSLGVAQIERPQEPVLEYIESCMWDPEKPI